MDLKAAADAAGAAHVELVKAWLQAGATVLAALIVAGVGTIAGAWLTRRYARERDRQDKESQWRTHAIELTKLDADRLLKAAERQPEKRLEPFILTFLANYRDLTELGSRTPGELYVKILRDRIARGDGAPSSGSASTAPGDAAIWCSGEAGAGSHPKVYLAIPAGGAVTCPYCGRRYSASAASGGH